MNVYRKCSHKFIAYSRCRFSVIRKIGKLIIIRAQLADVEHRGEKSEFINKLTLMKIEEQQHMELS